MKDFPEDVELQKLNARYERIRSAVGETQAAAERARKQMPQLHQNLADTVFKAALGEATEADVNAARFAIVYAERAIDAGDLVAAPARRAETRLVGEMTKISQRRYCRQQFEDLKAKITDAGGYTNTQAHQLRELSVMLNGTPDNADAFLADKTESR